MVLQTNKKKIFKNSPNKKLDININFINTCINVINGYKVGEFCKKKNWCNNHDSKKMKKEKINKIKMAQLKLIQLKKKNLIKYAQIDIFRLNHSFKRMRNKSILKKHTLYVRSDIFIVLCMIFFIMLNVIYQDKSLIPNIKKPSYKIFKRNMMTYKKPAIIAPTMVSFYKLNHNELERRNLTQLLQRQQSFEMNTNDETISTNKNNNNLIDAMKTAKNHDLLINENNLIFANNTTKNKTYHSFYNVKFNKNYAQLWDPQNWRYISCEQLKKYFSATTVEDDIFYQYHLHDAMLHYHTNKFKIQSATASQNDTPLDNEIFP